jgi:hypothetical protein
MAFSVGSGYPFNIVASSRRYSSFYLTLQACVIASGHAWRHAATSSVCTHARQFLRIACLTGKPLHMPVIGYRALLLDIVS